MRRTTLTWALTITIIVCGSLSVQGATTTVTPITEGSSNPTYFAMNHRVAVTAGHRTLVVHGRHARGVQLRWKDEGSSTWNTTTQGAVSDGMLLDGTGSGDWPSSIQVAKVGSTQRAWVVMGDVNFVGANPIRMRVLSGLDAPGGPTVGPIVLVDNAPRGDAFVDLALERTPAGSFRGAVSFVRRVDDRTWRVIVSWFTDLNTNSPSFVGAHAIMTSTTGRKQSTLVNTRSGLALLVRGAKGEITMFAHSRTAPLTAWVRKSTGVFAVAQAKPNGTGLANGDVVMSVEDKTAANHVTVQRFKPGGGVKTMLRLSGFSMPTVASFRNDIWLVMIRNSDGFVVSRHFNPISGWSRVRIEVGAGQGGHYAWPNTYRSASGRLRFVVRAGSSGVTRSGVIEVDRPVAAGPTCTKTGTAGPNTLVGTPGRDVLCGGGGNDILRGGRGRDVLIGGSGADVLNGGPGADHLYGGPGWDRCSAEPSGMRRSCERHL